jgi:hypothetical protein
MNGERTLEQIAAALSKCRLEAILIGNAGAAIQGAPVTTLDFDFMFRKTPANLRKLKRLADDLKGCVLRPYYPMSGLYRLTVDECGLQLDFMSRIHGVRSFESLRSRASEVRFGGHRLLVASLQDIVASKRAADRPRDKAVLEVLDRTLHEKNKSKT